MIFERRKKNTNKNKMIFERRIKKKLDFTRSLLINRNKLKKKRLSIKDDSKIKYKKKNKVNLNNFLLRIKSSVERKTKTQRIFRSYKKNKILDYYTNKKTKCLKNNNNRNFPMLISKKKRYLKNKNNTLKIVRNYNDHSSLEENLDFFYKFSKSQNFNLSQNESIHKLKRLDNFLNFNSSSIQKFVFKYKSKKNYLIKSKQNASERKKNLQNIYRIKKERFYLFMKKKI